MIIRIADEVNTLEVLLGGKQDWDCKGAEHSGEEHSSADNDEQSGTEHDNLHKGGRKEKERERERERDKRKFINITFLTRISHAHEHMCTLIS